MWEGLESLAPPTFVGDVMLECKKAVRYAEVYEHCMGNKLNVLEHNVRVYFYDIKHWSIVLGSILRLREKYEIINFRFDIKGTWDPINAD